MSIIIRIMCLVFISTLLSSQSHAMMTKSEYESIAVGAPISYVKEIAGKPYRIITEKDGSKSFNI